MYNMIKFSVIFICVSERCFLCMIVHENVPWERESKKVCVFKCMCVCTRTRMCVCTCALAWMSVCTGVKCYMNVSLYRGEMLQLPCPRVHETHVMQIELILRKAWHVTSRTWAIQKNVEIGVLRFCWAGATKFSIFAFKMWWHHMY